MRLSAAALVLALLGVVAGAALVGVAAVGGAVIFDSLCVGVWAVLRETGEAQRQAQGAPTLHEVLERAKAS